MAVRSAYETIARRELLEYLKATPGRHCTAAEIRDHFTECGRPLSMATIYRQLERFTAEGRIRKYILGPGESACYAYEDGRQCCSHLHCKCEICDRLIHLDCEERREIQTHLLEQHGFSWDRGKTVLYGICEDCRKA